MKKPNDPKIKLSFDGCYNYKKLKEEGLIEEETDTSIVTKKDLNVVTKIKPSDQEIDTMLFGWKVLKHIKSNGILIVKNNTTVGVGAGQVSRIDSVDIAIKKSGTNRWYPEPDLNRHEVAFEGF